MTYPPQKQPLRPVPPSNARIAKAHAAGTVTIKLISVDVTLQRLELAYAEIPEAMANLKKIRRWLTRCWESVGAGKKKLSAAVQRRADAETAAIDTIRARVLGTDWTAEHWTAWMIALDALIHDVVCCWEGGKAACWRYLGQTWDTLARRYLAQCQDGGRAEEMGTRIYLETVEALGWT
jgi:hypothetical protein